MRTSFIQVFQRLQLYVVGLTIALVFLFVQPSFAQPLTIIAEVSLGNKVKGTIEQVQGKTQEAVGNLSGDRETQIQGKVEQAEGQIRSVSGGANSEAEVMGKSQQAESNIRRYQSDER